MPPLKTTAPTLRDVAQKAGVSVATVSRALNKTGPVNAETEAKIMSAIAELNYYPNMGARSLASSNHSTDTLGLLVSEISGGYFAPMMRGIEAGAKEHDLRILIYTTQGTNSYPFGKHNTDGLLVFADSVLDAELIGLYESRFPVVLLNRSAPDGLPIPSISIENQKGAYQAVEHLIGVHGCHRIAFLAGPGEQEDASWRELGYREALAAHGLPIDPALIGYGGFNEHEARLTVAAWMRKSLDIDAIFASDDDSAVGALNALNQAGLRVPDDVAVIGFDNADFASYMIPPLTTIHASIEKVGYEAVQQLVKLIHTQEADKLTLLPTQLVIRQSCGCKPQQ